MLVPLMMLVADVLPIHELRTLTPRGKTANGVPWFENETPASVLSIAPTVMADGSDAGE
jgi:hypothetical protein